MFYCLDILFWLRHSSYELLDKTEPLFFKKSICKKLGKLLLLNVEEIVTSENLPGMLYLSTL